MDLVHSRTSIDVANKKVTAATRTRLAVVSAGGGVADAFLKALSEQTQICVSELILGHLLTIIP
jgi:hypothetical protein